MLESKPTSTKELRRVITDALTAGVVTKDEILDMVSTAEPPAANNGRAPAEPATGANDLPIYTELPEGLIELSAAAEKLGCTVHRIRAWVRRGQVQVRGRLRSGCPGGGHFVVAEADLKERLAAPQNKGGRPRKTRINK